MQLSLGRLLWGLLVVVVGFAGQAWAAAPPPPLAMFTVEVQDSSCNGAIGDFVWFDENGNGLRDAAEATKGINGVVLELRDSSGALVATSVSGTAVGSIPGSYQFSFICPGTYTVSIVSGVPAGYLPTISPPGADPTRDSSTSPATVTIVRAPNGQDTKDPTVDFGFMAGCSGSIGDRVWNDANANGVQDAGEVGMSGVPVELSLNGSVVATTTTDANGNYTFGGLCPGAYTVTVATPTDFVASPPFGTPDTALDSDVSGVVVLLGLNENNPTIDFGFFPLCAGVIGDRVWFDSNANGIQNTGELGIAGVTLELLNSSGTVIATTVSDANGNYLFQGLCAGSYTVRVDAATVPTGYVATLTSPPAAGTPANDSNGSPAPVVLASGSSSNLTIDFGYLAPCVGAIGDFVWSDINQNGIQDAGEPGIPHVRVTLRDAATDAVLGVDITDANGRYRFEGLCAGNYIVEVDPTTLPPMVLPSPANQGSNDAIDSDGINHEAAVTLPANNSTNLTIDFGYFKVSSQIQLVKLTNGTDNNTATGPVVPIGSTVTWTYRVTNAGSSEALYNVVVIDDNGTPLNAADDFSPVFTGGDTDNDGQLDVGETWIYVATGTAVAGQYRNVARASGIGVITNKPTPEVQDPDHYYGAKPSIGIVKTANKNQVVFGEPVTFTYVVTNTGTVTLTDIVVVDDNATPSYKGDDFTVGTVATLAPGAKVTFTATRIPPTKMCNHDWQGKLRKCGMMIIFDWMSHKKFTYLQAKDHRDDHFTFNGWWGRRSYSHKGKFRIYDKNNVNSADTYVESEALDDEEYVSAFSTLVTKSYVESTNKWVHIPKIFHKKGWDRDWRDDWDWGWGDWSRSRKWDDDRGWGHNDQGDYDHDKHPKPCTTTSTNIAKVTAKYNGQVLMATDKETVEVVAPAAPSAPYKTFTQGGWGAKPSGNNPGKFLADNFNKVYTDGKVTIGGSKWLKFTSANAIQNFLPQGGTPAKLTSSYTNPTHAINVLAGQVLALQLNVNFSAKGLTRQGLGNLTVVSGKLAGKKVSQVLDTANSVLGGGSLPSGVTISDLNAIVAKINENFDGGTTNNGYLKD